MSLTVGLAVIGGLLLAGVIAHGAWVQRRHAPRTALPEDDLRKKSHDAERIEPGLAGDEGDASAAPFSFTAALHTYFRLHNGIASASIEGLQGVKYLDSLQARKECIEENETITFPVFSCWAIA